MEHFWEHTGFESELLGMNPCYTSFRQKAELAQTALTVGSSRKNEGKVPYLMHSGNERL